jgi:hypothetical protein
MEYNPETGIFTRLETCSKRAVGARKGTVVGSLDRGYLRTNIDKKLYLMHRLAFLYMEGYFPEFYVDHIDGNPLNNKWENLRHASATCNAQNKGIAVVNTVGYKGVYFSKREHRYTATISVRKKKKHLGYFSCPLEAALTRITVEEWCPEWECTGNDANKEKVFRDLQAAIKAEDPKTWRVDSILQTNNSTGYIGVRKYKGKKGGYSAIVTRFKDHYNLGIFKTAKEAAVVFDKFVISKGWHDRNLNFPELRFQDQPYEVQ